MKTADKTILIREKYFNMQKRILQAANRVVLLFLQCFNFVFQYFNLLAQGFGNPGEVLSDIEVFDTHLNVKSSLVHDIYILLGINVLLFTGFLMPNWYGAHTLFQSFFDENPIGGNDFAHHGIGGGCFNKK